MNKLATLIFLALMLGCPPPLECQDVRGAGARPLAAEQRVALVIGNADYNSDIGRLKNPTNDAADVAASLGRLGFTLVGGKAHLNLSKRQMLELIREFGGRIQRGGVGVFYFAGHGVQVDKHNYLIPITDQLQYQEDAEYEAVDADAVLREMEYAGNSVNILILDACRNNNLPKKRRDAAKGLTEPSRKPEGTLIAFSTADGQTASDNSGGRNGLFTQELLKYLETPNQPLDRVFRTVRNEVKRLSQNSQVPFLYQSLSEDVFLNATESAAAAPRPQPSPPAQPKPSPSPTVPDAGKSQPLIKSSAADSPRSALAELMRGRDGLASKLADDALKANKNLAPELAVRGWIKTSTNDLKKSSQLEPRNALYHSLLARIYRNEATNDLAVAEARSSLLLTPSPNTATDYFARGLARKVILMLSTDGLPDDELKGMFADFAKATELDPQFAMAYYELGGSYLNPNLSNEKTYEAAVTSLSKAIEISPNLWFYRMRGIAYASGGEYDNALADFNKALEVNNLGRTMAAGLIYLRGDTYFLKGENGKAFLDFEKVIQMEPKNASGYLGRAKTYEKYGLATMADADRKRSDKLSTFFVGAVGGSQFN